jgi:hypothetical protein
MRRDASINAACDNDGVEEIGVGLEGGYYVAVSAEVHSRKWLGK